MTPKDITLVLIVALLVGLALGFVVAGAVSRLEFDNKMQENIEIFNRECVKAGGNYNFSIKGIVTISENR